MSASSNSTMSSSSMSSSPSSMSSNDSPAPAPVSKKVPAPKAPAKGGKAPVQAPVKGKGGKSAVETAPVNPPETTSTKGGKGSKSVKEDVPKEAPKAPAKGGKGSKAVKEEVEAPAPAKKGKSTKVSEPVVEAPAKAGKGKATKAPTKEAPVEAPTKGGKAPAKEVPVEAPTKGGKGKAPAKEAPAPKGGKKVSKADSEEESDTKVETKSADNLITYVRGLFKSDPDSTCLVSKASLVVLDLYIERMIQTIVKQVTNFASIKRATTFNVDLFNKAIKSLDTHNVLEEMEDREVDVVLPAPRIRRRIQSYTTLPEGDELKVRMGKESPVVVALAIRNLILSVIPRIVQEMEKNSNKTIMPRHVITAIQSSHELDNFVNGVTAGDKFETVTLPSFSVDFDSLRKPTAKSRAVAKEAPAKGAKATTTTTKDAPAPTKGGKGKSTTTKVEAPVETKAPAKGGKTTTKAPAPVETKAPAKGKGKVAPPKEDSGSDMSDSDSDLSDSDADSAPKAPAKGGKGKSVPAPATKGGKGKK